MEEGEEDLLLIESSDDDLRYSIEKGQRQKHHQPEMNSSGKRVQFTKEVKLLESSSILEDQMSSIRMSHDTTYDFLAEGPSLLMKTSDMPIERSTVREARHKPSLVRSLRPSDISQRPLHQSVSRINRKIEFDEFRTKSISFDKKLASVKALKHILSLKKSDRIQDFKEFFNDARTLIVYEETIKLTMLLQQLKKDIVAIQLEFEKSLAESERFVELSEKMKQLQRARKDECAHLKRIIQEKDDIICQYEQALDMVIAERQQQHHVIPLVTSVQPEEEFKIDKTLERIRLPRTEVREQQTLFVTPITLEVSPNQLETEPKKHENIEINVFEHGDTTFVERPHKEQSQPSEEDILLSLRENLQEVTDWFVDHSKEITQLQPSATLNDSSLYLQKVSSSFFTLCKIILASSNNLEQLLSHSRHLNRSDLHRRCLKECLQAISTLSRQATTVAMQCCQATPILHRHLAQHEHFAKDICRLCFSNRQ